jgi:hypothetical protein
VSITDPEQAPFAILMIGLPLVATTRWGLLSAWMFWLLAGRALTLIDFSLPPFASTVIAISTRWY